MSLAFLAHVHGNSIALEAVLRHIQDKKTADGIYFLGNVIGWGSDPVHCLRVGLHSMIAGDQEKYAHSPHTYNSTTHQHIQQIAGWNNKQLNLDTNLDNYLMMENIPEEEEISAAGIQLYLAYDKWNSHSLNEINPNSVGRLNAEKILNSMNMNEILVAGCSSLPCVYRPGDSVGNPSGRIRKATSRVSYILDDQPHIITAGSVGFPRASSEDRASYVTFDPIGRKVTVHYVQYDVDKAINELERVGVNRKLRTWMKQMLTQNKPNLRTS